MLEDFNSKEQTQKNMIISSGNKAMHGGSPERLWVAMCGRPATKKDINLEHLQVDVRQFINQIILL